VIEPPVILNARYQIIKSLAQSQYRRTYLARDSYRFDEFCVIKESIELESSNDRFLQETQFRQEAQILYQLNHPQIPRFRETFRLEQPEQTGLYYVRDYIPGLTYRELLKLRLSQQKYFSETEIVALLKQLLPVVDYLHSMGVYHQEISLDNLICRKWDQLPILIDFSQVQTLENTSHVLSPHQDLAQLAIALSILLTGKEPQQLFAGETYNWQDDVRLSPKLKQIFGKMLTDTPSDRCSTAQDVMEFLEQPDRIEEQPPIDIIPSPPVTVSTPEPKETMVTLSRNKQGRFLGCLSQLGLVLAVSLGSGTLGWFFGKTWLKPPSQPTLTFENKDLPFSPDPTLSPASSEQAEEWQRKADLRKRRQELGINNQFFQLLVDQIFSSRYPEYAVKATSADPIERREGQLRRDETATELLDKLSSLGEEARGELGSFDRPRRQELVREANDLNLSSRALYDLANAQFYHQFPQENPDNMEQPTGQILSAMLLDNLRSLQSETNYEQITELPVENAINRLGNLEPGKGQVYVIQLEADREVEFQLNASQETQLSIYSPSGRNNLLEDSTKTFWMGTLPESGLYEIVIVSKSDSAFDYQFDVRVLSSGQDQ
jgi:serine/threonine protein kinase, bacterial